MGQHSYPFQPRKHVCIFELEREGLVSTGAIVCTVCGVYLSSPERPSAQDMTGSKQESQRNE